MLRTIKIHEYKKKTRAETELIISDRLIDPLQKFSSHSNVIPYLDMEHTLIKHTIMI